MMDKDTLRQELAFRKMCDTLHHYIAICLHNDVFVEMEFFRDKNTYTCKIHNRDLFSNMYSVDDDVTMEMDVSLAVDIVDCVFDSFEELQDALQSRDFKRHWNKVEEYIISTSDQGFEYSVGSNFVCKKF